METKRELLISKGWIQAVALVGLCGFLLLGILAYRTYTDEPPIPSKVIGANSQLLFTGEDVSYADSFQPFRLMKVRLGILDEPDTWTKNAISAEVAIVCNGLLDKRLASTPTT